MNCLCQVRLNVLHILDGLFVCCRFLIADEVRIGYFFSKSGHLAESSATSIAKFSIETLSSSTVAWSFSTVAVFPSIVCVRCQFSVTPNLVFGILLGLLLPVSDEIVDHLSYLFEAFRLVIGSGTRGKSAPHLAQVPIFQFHDHFQLVNWLGRTWVPINSSSSGMRRDFDSSKSTKLVLRATATTRADSVSVRSLHLFA